MDISKKLSQALSNGRNSNGRAKISELSLQNIAGRVINVYEKVKKVDRLNLF